jgi:hypothetical protein
VCIECAQNRMACPFRINNKFLPLRLVNTDTILWSYNRKGKINSLFKHKNATAQSEKFSNTVLEEVFGKRCITRR